eukprot:6238474-Amphidinium_carterae.1
MPWGLPWWAWLFICLGMLILCGLAAGIAAALMNRPKAKKSPEMVTETQWVVEDVMDDEAGFDGPSDRSMFAQPTATTPMLTQPGGSAYYGY